MKRKLILLFLLVFIGGIKKSLSQIIFQRTYGDNQNDMAHACVPTNDRGYVILGSMDTFTFGNAFDFFLIKTDSVGDTLWTKCYGGTAMEEGFTIQQTSDNGYILGGYTISFGAGAEDFYLIKTDSIGDTLWTKAYGGFSSDIAYSVRQSMDGGYILAGNSRSFGNGFLDGYAVKVDSAGNLLWTKSYGGNDDDEFHSAIQTTDSGYAFVGTTIRPGDIYPDVLLVKTDFNGDTLWTKAFGGSGFEEGFDIQQSHDGGYIIAGHTGYDFLLIKTDSIGDTTWTKSYGSNHSDIAYSIYETYDYNFIVAGITYYSGSHTIEIAKVDSSGNMLWGNLSAFVDEYSTCSIHQAYPEGYIISASSYYNGANANDALLIKTDDDGIGCSAFSYLFSTDNTLLDIKSSSINVGNGGVENYTNTIVSTGCLTTMYCLNSEAGENHFSKPAISIAPNPFHSEAKLVYENGKIGNSNLNLVIYNVMGEKIREEKISNLNSYILHRNGLPDGLYFFQLSTLPTPSEGQAFNSQLAGSGKFIVE